jgi:hypothetical protein
VPRGQRDGSLRPSSRFSNYQNIFRSKNFSNKIRREQRNIFYTFSEETLKQKGLKASDSLWQASILNKLTKVLTTSTITACLPIRTGLLARDFVSNNVGVVYLPRALNY